MDTIENKININEMIKEYGYPLEIHTVTTDDGYILTLHRIPPIGNTIKREGTPILILHGILNSAADFVNLGPKKALSFLLADEGFDVWLANSRGNTWSRKHKTLCPDENPKEFWNFSFHETGLYDIPASIDYIIDKTGYKKIEFVGYSQGVASFFVMGSERKKYLEKIKFMTALAPAVFMNETISPFAKFLIYFRQINELLIDLFDIHEILNRNGMINSFLRYICHEDSFFVDLCIHLYSILHGYDNEQVNKTLLPVIFQNLPAGSSSKQHLHLIQLLESGEFQKYDFGKILNQVYYGQSVPISYNLSKITVPVAIYHSKNDWIVQPKDVKRLINKLPNIRKVFQVPHDKFNHHDFLYAKDVDKFLYQEIIKEILKH